MSSNITIGNFHYTNWMAVILDVLVRQVVSVPAIIGLKVTPGDQNRIVIQVIHIGNDDYAAGRLIDAQHINESGSFIKDLMSDTIDNQRIAGPGIGVISDSTTQNTPLALGATMLPLMVVENDSIQVRGTSLVDNEEITIKMRYWAQNKLATLSKVVAAHELEITKHQVVA